MPHFSSRTAHSLSNSSLDQHGSFQPSICPLVKQLSADGKGVEGIDPKRPFGAYAAMTDDVDRNAGSSSDVPHGGQRPTGTAPPNQRANVPSSSATSIGLDT